MTAPVLVTDPEIAAAALRHGDLVAFPTETVYGLGADAANEAAVRRIFAVKGRPADHPLILHMADAGQLERWSAVRDPVAERLAAAFWPGPLTLLVPRGPAVLDAVSGGRATVGLRVPAHPVALAMLEAFGGGTAAPSANRFGRVSPTTAQHVLADLGSDVDVVLDGGSCTVGVESTILDLTGPEPEIVRPGGVTADRLAEVLGREPNSWSGSGPARAPGMLATHYAPQARLEIVTAAALASSVDALLAAGQRVAVLAPAGVDLGGTQPIVLARPSDAEQYARELFGCLRAADDAHAEVVLAVPPESVGIGAAVADRLRRAASA